MLEVRVDLIVIVARSDARQGVSLEEALVRTKLFADAGADVCFIDALGSVEEMKAFCQVAPRVPKLVRLCVCRVILLVLNK